MSLEPAFVGIDPPRSGLRVDHLPAVAADSCAFQGADLLGSSWALTPRAHQSNSKGSDITTAAPTNSVQLSLVASTATQVALLHGRRRAQLKSWAVRAGASTELTHAAVAFPGTDVLVAVQSDTRMVAWSLDHDNISQGSKATLSTDVHSLLVAKQLPDCVVVVLEDASFVVMSPALKEIIKHDTLISSSITTSSSTSASSSSVVVIAAELVVCGRSLVLVMATQESSTSTNATTNNKKNKKNKSITTQTATLHMVQLSVPTEAGEHGPATELSATALASHILTIPTQSGVAADGRLIGFACQPKSTSNFGLEMALLWEGANETLNVLEFVRFLDKPSGASLAAAFKQTPTPGACLPLAVGKIDIPNKAPVAVVPSSAVKRSARKPRRSKQQADTTQDGGALVTTTDTTEGGRARVVGVQMAGLGHGRFGVAWVGQAGDTVNLSTLDSLYGVLTSNVELSADAVGARPVQLERSRFTSSVTLATVAGVHVFELGLERSSLCSVLGAHWQTARVTAPGTDGDDTTAAAAASKKQTTTDVVTTTAATAPVSLALCLKGDAAPEQWAQIMKDTKSRQDKAITQLSSDAETPDETTFENVFFSHLFPNNNNTTTGKKRARSASQGDDAAASITDNETAAAMLSQAFVAAVVKRSCRSGFWGPLLWLLRRGKVSCNSQPTLMQDLRRHRQWNLLYVALQHVPDVPEREIVDTLLFALAGAPTADAQAFEVAYESRNQGGDGGGAMVMAKKKKLNRKHPNSKANIAKTVQDSFVLGLDVSQRAVLRLTLAACSVPHNEAFLRQHVKRLSVSAIELLLASLCRALTVLDACSMSSTISSISANSKASKHGAGDNRRVSVAGLCLPARAHVVKWICALLDAHFRDLVLAVPTNKPLGQVLLRVQALVQKEALLCDSMGVVGHALDHVVHGRSLPAERSAGGEYVIERVAW